jgi:hypothetical protein
MIDIEKIKALPDQKPQKGPNKMSKSEKSPAQEKWKKEQSRLRQFRSRWRGEVEGVCGITGFPIRRIHDRLSQSIHDRLRVVREVEQILRDVEESLGS